jgi:exodeoxyribonuclease III
MKLVAWNIRHGGSNHTALASALLAHDPDVIVLGEYRSQGSEELVEKLRFFGWPHVAASTVTGKANGVAIVSRVAMEPKALPLGSLPFDMWAVEAAVPEANLTVLGVYAPLIDSEGSSPAIQKQFWQAVHRMADTRSAERVLLVGDFNTGATGGDCPSSLPCADAFQHLSTLRWTDSWRACNPGCSDFSYVHRSAGPPTNWRIDHAFVSPELAGSVRGCRYSHTERENRLSDHSMLLVDID